MRAALHRTSSEVTSSTERLRLRGFEYLTATSLLLIGENTLSCTRDTQVPGLTFLMEAFYSPCVE